MAVQRKYSADFENKFNKLWFQGYVEFERWELLSWFGKDRITRAVWNDIQEHWNSYFDDEPKTLKIIKCDDTTSPQKYLVIITDKLIDMSEMTSQPEPE